MNNIQIRHISIFTDIVGFPDEHALVNDLLKCLNRRPHSIDMSGSKPDIDNTCIVLGGIVFEEYPKGNETTKNVRYKIRLRYGSGILLQFFFIVAK